MSAEHTRQDRIARGVMRTVGALPPPVLRLLAGRPTRIDGQVLHPEVQVALRLLHLAGGPTFETLPVPEGRAQISSEAWVFGDELPVESVRDLELEARGGPIPARLYRPAGLADPSALLVYFHGGGWVLGGLDASDSACRFLAQHAELAVLSVDYRLAPEHPFPAGVEDAVDAFHAAVAAAGSWGVDPAAIGVGGESAGGNLAAVVAQLTHADDGPEPAFQLLFFPVTDLSSKHPSYTLFSEGYFLTEAQMDWYQSHYLPDPALATDPRVSPLLAEDLSGLCPAYVAVAGFDPLRDEGEAYARRLREAGVRVSLQRHRGLIHGIVNATGVGRSGREVLLQAAGALRIGLGSRAGSA